MFWILWISLYFCTSLVKYGLTFPNCCTYVCFSSYILRNNINIIINLLRNKSSTWDNTNIVFVIELKIRLSFPHLLVFGAHHKTLTCFLQNISITQWRIQGVSEKNNPLPNLRKYGILTKSLFSSRKLSPSPPTVGGTLDPPLQFNIFLTIKT